MLPWSVIAIASIPEPLAWSSRGPILLAPSSRLNCVWTCRWAKLTSAPPPAAHAVERARTPLDSTRGVARAWFTSWPPARPSLHRHRRQRPRGPRPLSAPLRPVLPRQRPQLRRAHPPRAHLRHRQPAAWGLLRRSVAKPKLPRNPDRKSAW